jgi:hypothetical protein
MKNEANTKSLWNRARPSIIPTREVVQNVQQPSANTALETEFMLWAESLSDDDVQDKYPNAYAFWKANQPGRPTWALIAYDYMPIPAMSAEAERVFSRYLTIQSLTNEAANKQSTTGGAPWVLKWWKYWNVSDIGIRRADSYVVCLVSYTTVGFWGAF